MQTRILYLTLGTLALTSCDPYTINEDVGGISGAIVGGVIGSQFGDGTGQAVMTGLGAVVGHKIGSSLGSQLDDFNQASLGEAMETVKPNHWESWVNPNDRKTYRVRPGYTEKLKVEGRSTNCRPYQLVQITPNETIRSSGYACRYQENNWRFFTN
ncbi:MAG: hypothetical protein CMF46_02165 [Legionellales bacterium]|nr:hypothetical protein [Legionellales bacterium]|tara:strand:+ start:2596 stop:3063 length:468 start_codon:yes stop_codon:yes gene_type:complete